MYPRRGPAILCAVGFPPAPGSERSRGGFGSGLVAGLTLGLIIAAAVFLAVGLISDDEDDAVAEARELVENNYFEEVPGERLDEASIRGMVDDLRRRYDDDFSHYFSPEQLEEFEASTSGRFDGVGLTVSEVPRGLRVASVLPNSPAAASRIEEGDLIVAVNGKSIAGVPSQVATARIKGPAGTSVELRVLPGGGGEPYEAELERASVRVPAVQGKMRRIDGRKVGYVIFSTFSDGAHGELREQVERLVRAGAEGIIIDMRGNGGGLLNEAILSSSVFVEEGRIVSTRSRTQGDRDYDAVGDPIDPVPLVVLVNRDSASATEIFAAALAHHDLATVVGTRTYGKGTFQEVIEIPAGGALDLTIGQYLTADGTSIAGKGVQPDVRASDDPKTEDEDEGLDQALEVIGERLPSPSSP